MTVTTTSTASVPAAGPSRKLLLWVTWRQHRATIGACGALLTALSGTLVISGVAIHRAAQRDGLSSCGSLDGAACSTPVSILTRDYGSWPQLLPDVLWFLPLILGLFFGAPLVARELETGTFRFAWTQGTSRTRLLLAKLVILGALLTVLTIGFTGLFDWWYRPWLGILGRMGSGTAYELAGPVLTAQTLFAFTLGVLIGALTRRPVAAIAVTALLWLAIVIPASALVRPHLQTPLTATADSSTITSHAITLNQWVTDPAGKRLTPNQLDRVAINAGPDLTRTGESLDAWLRQHRYTKWVTYQPENRFWRFQAIESAAYTGLAAMLGISALLWIRRKT